MIICKFDINNTDYYLVEHDNYIALTDDIYSVDYYLLINIYELKYLLNLTKRKYKKYNWLEQYISFFRKIRVVHINVLSRKFNSVAKAFTLAYKDIITFVRT